MKKQRTRHRIHAIAALAAAFAAVSCGPTRDSALPSSDPREVTFRNGAGAALQATLYPGSGSDARGLVFVHGVGSSRSAWGGFPERVQAKGYACLVIDLAGHGASTADGTTDFRLFSEEQWRERVSDVAAAREALIHYGCDPGNIGLIGAGFGASLAVADAAREGAATLVLLSPTLDQKGIALLPLATHLDRVPILVLAAEGDGAAVNAGERLHADAPGFCEYRAYPGSLYGADLLAGSESAALQILQWLEQTLPAGQAN